MKYIIIWIVVGVIISGGCLFIPDVHPLEALILGLLYGYLFGEYQRVFLKKDE